LNLAQLSEFSLLLVPVGMAAGDLTAYEGSVISYAMMLSVLFATYGIKYNYQFAQLLGRIFSRLSATVAKDSTREPRLENIASPSDRPAKIAILGYHTNTEALIRKIKAERPEWLKDILVIDYNLENHPQIEAYGVKVAYGDIGNFETLRHYGIDRIPIVLSTISDTFLRGTSNQELMGEVKKVNPEVLFITTALRAEKSDEFMRQGAFACVCPPTDAAPSYMRHIERAKNKIVR
jgi:hypothetical protein